MGEWKEYKLGDVCDRVCSGGTPSSRQPEYYDGDIPWLNTKEINFNRIYSTEKCITEEGLSNSSAKWIENSDRAAESIMDIEVKVDDGKTEVSFDYDGGKYKRESIATFSKVFVFCCLMILQIEENAGLTIGEVKKQWQKR